MGRIYADILERLSQRKKMLAVLIDPEKISGDSLSDFVKQVEEAKPDLILVGGSQYKNSLSCCVDYIKHRCSLPVLAFPASAFQLSSNVDGILLLSLISGRNPQFLIGEHVKAATMLHRSGIEVIPTGYILLEGGRLTAVACVSETVPMSQSEVKPIVSTAIAGELLGHKLIYLEAGSGARNEVSPSIIRAVSKELSIPLVVGGGIDSIQKMLAAFDAGANLVVIGNYFEQFPEEVGRFCDAVRSYTPK